MKEGKTGWILIAIGTVFILISFILNGVANDKQNEYDENDRNGEYVNNSSQEEEDMANITGPRRLSAGFCLCSIVSLPIGVILFVVERRI